MVVSLNSRSLDKHVKPHSETAMSRAAGGVIFFAVFLLSALALAAVAVAAPVVLALSALAGLIAGNKSGNGWRSAGA